MTKTTTQTVCEFLLDRIAEEEERARLWRETWARDGGVIDLALTPGPARVLAQCKAHRRIVERCSAVDYAMPSTHLAHGILAELASTYANHPDYRQEWRP